MTDLQIMIEFANQIKTLEGLKALAHKYDNTELTLTEAEWITIKENHIDKRDWLRCGMTSDEFYNDMIKSSRKILDNTRTSQLINSMEFNTNKNK
tara:strand:- start:320 stop:604 length:285 start_codon:yes stop_codon:yes gene_type:complete